MLPKFDYPKHADSPPSADPALAAVEAFDRAFADCAAAAERAEALAPACAALAPASMRVAIPEMAFSSVEALDVAYRRARGELRRLEDQLEAARRETGYGTAQTAWEAAAERKIEAEKAALSAEPRTPAGARALLGFVEGYLREYGEEFASDVVAPLRRVAQAVERELPGAGAPDDADAELLRLGEDLEASWRGMQALEKAPPPFAAAEGNDLFEIAAEKNTKLLEAVCDAPATTLAGLRVKARAVLICHAGDWRSVVADFTKTSDFRLAGSILGDLLNLQPTASDAAGREHVASVEID